MKRQRKCSVCGKPGHRADSCAKRTAKQPRARRAASAEPTSNGPTDFATKAQEAARIAVRVKLQEELTWARAYLAELERLAGA